MKRIFLLFILITLVLSTNLWAGDYDFGFGIGYVSPLLNIKNIGDDFFGEGAGDEWEQIIGLHDVSGTYWIMGNARYYMGKRIALEAEVGYWTKTEKTKPGTLDFVDVNSSFKDFSIGGNLIYILRGKSYSPFAGGGVAIHFLRAKTEPIGFPEIAVDGSKNKVGLCLLGGIEIKLHQHLSIYGAGRYDYIPDWSQWKIYSGLRFHF